MEIHITDEKTIEDIQRQFTDHFPQLKLEFYKSEHEQGEGSSESEHLDSTAQVGKIRHDHTLGDISIHGNQKVSTLESAFRDVYGLNVQVFRKSGDVWLQTTATDDWTLSDQNQTSLEHEH